VPQGSCLSPHLFSIYINDMPLDKNSKTALFADDTLFYASSNTHSTAIKRLQKQIDTVQPWFDDWKITINACKTSTILFSNKSPRNIQQIKIKNTPIKWSPSIKYLGVTIDKNLTFAKHIKNVTIKANNAKHLLFPLLSSTSNLKLSLKTYLYKSYIRPILTYATPSWSSNISTRSWKKLEIIQSKILRTISGQPWFTSNHTIRHSTCLTTLKETCAQQTTNFKNSITNSPHQHIQEISTRTIIKQRFKHRPIDF